jgi:hypothetical protein
MPSEDTLETKGMGDYPEVTLTISLEPRFTVLKEKGKGKAKSDVFRNVSILVIRSDHKHMAYVRQR